MHICKKINVIPQIPKRRANKIIVKLDQKNRIIIKHYNSISITGITIKDIRAYENVETQYIFFIDKMK